MHARPPAVAGMFYPSDPAELAATVDALLGEAEPDVAPPPKVLVVPHAGYIYSGSTAAAGYALLKPSATVIRRVVLLGPTHRVAVAGLALPESEAFATPLGTIPVDAAAVAAIAEMPQIVFSDHVHQAEHSLEVHLPFLQRVLDRFSLVPLAVGHASAEAVAEVLDRLWGGPETLIVVSTDLSHYRSYEQARRIDADTCRHVLDLDASLQPEQACGAFPLNGLLLAARRRGLTPTLLAACNSGDSAGDRQRVVGYAAFALSEAGHA